MKKLVFCLILSTFAVACSDVNTDIPIPAGDLTKKPRDNAKENFEPLNIKVASDNSPIAYAENNWGLSIIIGNKGVWFNQREALDMTITKKGKNVDVAINDDQESSWIAAGSEGVFVDSDLVLDKNIIGDADSHYSVSININREWIAAGNKAVYIKRANMKKPMPIKNLNAASGSQHIKVKIFDDGRWTIVSEKDVWESRPDSFDGSSQPSDPEVPFPVPGVRQ